MTMSRTVKIRKHGNSLGVTFPKDLVGEFGFSEGDELYVVHTPQGIQLSPYDPTFEQALESAKRLMRRYPNAMRKLAEG